MRRKGFKHLLISTEQAVYWTLPKQRRYQTVGLSIPPTLYNGFQKSVAPLNWHVSSTYLHSLVFLFGWFQQSLSRLCPHTSNTQWSHDTGQGWTHHSPDTQEQMLLPEAGHLLYSWPCWVQANTSSQLQREVVKTSEFWSKMDNVDCIVLPWQSRTLPSASSKWAEHFPQ